MTHVELTAIPACETATDPIRSGDDLRQRWRALMGTLGFGERLLRFVFVGPDRRFVKVMTDVPIPSSPNRHFVEDLMAALAELVDDRADGTTVAFLLSRPGCGPVSPSDRGWAQLITSFGKKFDVPLEPIFRANDEALVQIPVTPSTG